MLSDVRCHGENTETAKLDRLLPLSARLNYHVEYTAREDASNGQSRRAAPSKRVVRVGMGA